LTLETSAPIGVARKRRGRILIGYSVIVTLEPPVDPTPGEMAVTDGGSHTSAFGDGANGPDGVFPPQPGAIAAQTTMAMTKRDCRLDI
jgi:hypothetical protein